MPSGEASPKLECWGEPLSDGRVGMRRVVLGVRLAMVVLYGAAILYFGTLPRGPLPPVKIANFDKLLHGLVFGGLGLLVYRAGRAYWRGSSAALSIWTALGWVAFWGGLLELVQSQTAYRSAEFADFLADVLGGLLFVGLAAKWKLERTFLRLL